MNNDAMQAARDELAAEEQAKVEARAAEIYAQQQQDARREQAEAARQQASADAAQELGAAGLGLPDLADKFDAAVAALVDLAQAAHDRNGVVARHDRRCGSAGLDPEYADFTRPTPVAELAAATVRAAEEMAERGGDDGPAFGQMTRDKTLSFHMGGNTVRRTPVERARRVV